MTDTVEVESEPDIVAVCELGYLDATEWSAEDDARAERLKAERNFEARLTRRSVTKPEYPTGPAGSPV